jgi:hypothetical protein
MTPPLCRGGPIEPIPGGQDGEVSQLLLNTKLQSLARLSHYTIKFLSWILFLNTKTIVIGRKICYSPLAEDLKGGKGLCGKVTVPMKRKFDLC